MKEHKGRRSGFQIMKQLVVLIRPLMPFMLLAVTFGVLGFVFSLMMTILGAHGVAKAAGFLGESFSYAWMVGGMIGAVLLRGFSRYAEQLSNHYIAFRILAELRGKVFDAMRRLAPAKLEGKNTGDLLSMITGDMELLEVFYAHTISPIGIAFICLIGFTGYIWSFHWALALVALIGYLLMSIAIPLVGSRRAAKSGVAVRQNIGVLNGTFLDLVRGIRETIQLGRKKEAIQMVVETSQSLSKQQKTLRSEQSRLAAKVEGLSMIFIVLFIVVAYILVQDQVVSMSSALIACLVFMASFGPFAAVAALGNTLSQTLACGDRLLNLLEEVPAVDVVMTGKTAQFGEMVVGHVTFGYGVQRVLHDVSLKIQPHEMLAITGKSGSGKSTLLKLLMRFWDPDQGSITMTKIPLPQMMTHSLWETMSYMTQASVFFEGTLRDNMLIARPDASDQDMMEAMDKASILSFVERLPNGLDTPVEELGDNFSGGERQRIGLARCFLSDAPMILLDEPTSNLDAQNEAVILKSLLDHRQQKTVLLVSHRESTTNICDRVLRMEEGCLAE